MSLSTEADQPDSSSKDEVHFESSTRVGESKRPEKLGPSVEGFATQALRKRIVAGTKDSSAMVERRRTDSELVNGSAAGDREAYRELVERYQQRVFAIAYELLKSREDAEDVAQEAFVKAFLSLPDFKGQSSFYTWLYRITYNMAIDFRRRQNRRGGQAVEFDEKQISAGGHEIDGDRFARPDQVLVQKEQAGELRKVLGELSEEHRVAVTLREVDGLSYDEIADVTGVSKGTVMSRLHYARKRLQSALLERGVYGDKRDGTLLGENGRTVMVKQPRPEVG